VPEGTRAAGSPGGHTTKELAVKTILVAYDDTAPSKRALERAAMIAEKFGSRVIITSIAPLVHSSPRSTATIDRSLHITAHEEMTRAQTELEGRGIAAEILEATGDPGVAIANLAAQQRADLVVVGTRELGPVHRLLGQESVSRTVSRRVHCDVLIVHPEHKPAT
jgi:nucleotide-binding universal stress UspA family protein